MSPIGSELKIAGHAAAAMRLNGIVDDAERHARCLHLDHGNLVPGNLVAGSAHHVGGLETESPRHFDVDASPRDPPFPHGMFCNALPAHLARPEAPGPRLPPPFSPTPRPHSMMHPPRPHLRTPPARSI